MDSDLSGAGATTAKRPVDEDHIFIRTARRTRYIRLTRLTRGAVALLAVGAVTWSAYATLRVVEGEIALAEAEMRLEAQAKASALRIGEAEATELALRRDMEHTRTRAAAADARLSELQERLVDATARLRSAQAEASALKSELDVALAARHEAQARLSEAEAAAEIASQVPVVDLREPAAEPGTGTLDAIANAIDNVISSRDAAADRAAALDGQLAAIEARIAEREAAAEARIKQIEEAARTGLEGLEQVFSRAGLDIDRILEDTYESFGAQGGPFEPLAEDASIDDQTEIRLAALMGDLERANLLRVAIDRLPFAAPVHGARRTSGFGKRRDPLRRTWAMHTGVDFAGPTGTPIVATADGVVTFAGRMSGYGRIVTVQHAFGYETRYAHLNSMDVRVGQRIRRGDRIGGMGRSGRTTGVHLHYEVRIGNSAVNPSKFIEAAREVL